MSLDNMPVHALAQIFARSDERIPHRRGTIFTPPTLIRTWQLNSFALVMRTKATASKDGSGSIRLEFKGIELGRLSLGQTSLHTLEYEFAQLRGLIAKMF
jgi:hypothetical protein